MDRDFASTLNQHNSDIGSQGPRRIFGEIEEILDEVEIGYISFKNFQVVDQAPSDHHYSTEWRNAWMKFVYKQEFRQRMEEEWRLLEEQTPSSIFVRTYRSRIDLMRVASIAPRGSDYQHCLFFFDISFPMNYPDVPPMIHYLSFGDHGSHPNLQPGGRVSLDILERWHGRTRRNWSCIGTREKWRPKEFNVLHLLHAMQGLISQHSSIDAKRGPPEEHGGMAFLSACEKMIRVLRKPPMGFEFLVRGHFRRRSDLVLLKFKENEYRDKIMVDLFKIMFRVFEENGSYCKHHLDFLKKAANIQEKVDEKHP